MVLVEALSGMDFAGRLSELSEAGMVESTFVKVKLATITMMCCRAQTDELREGSWRPRVAPRSLGRKLAAMVTQVVILLGLTAPASVAQTDEVPLDLQAALFEKIFRYVKTLDRPEEVVVLAVFEEDGRRRAKQVADAFTAIGVDSRPVEVQELGSAIDTGSVLYVLPSASSAEVAALCQERRLLSLSGWSTAVETGAAAVGVRLNDGRPQILVNMKRLERDGHRISADLLKLAKVIE